MIDPRASAFWVRLKANRLAYTLTILATLAIGILIGTIVSRGVKGQESKKGSDATPLSVPTPKELSNQFSQISKQLEPSVVNINTESTIKTQRRRHGPAGPEGEDQNPFDDFFDRFFGGPGGGNSGSIRERSLGSGVLVDAKGRNIVPNRQFQSFIQTDAAINPGNSGGPLVNMSGEVIGINTAILTDTNAYAGVGFALPSNTVVQVYNQLIGPEHRVSRGSIGIEFNAQENPAIARVYGVNSGVTISNVVAGSPADQAGLKVGDTITSVDGKPVKNGDDLVGDIAGRKPHTKVTLGFIRNGKKQETTVTVADRAKLFAARLGEQEEGGEEASPKESKLGLSVRAITPEIADRLDITAGKGVIVQDVKPGSFAEDAGVSRGDVILEINKQPVNSEEDFNRVASTLKSGQDVVFLVRQRGAGRQDGTIFLAGTLP